MAHGGGATLGYYDRGRTTIWASRMDPRFTWCAYVPKEFELADARHYRLLVAVHGTARLMTLYREAFADFADRHRFIILAPLFPGGITSPNDLSSYKLLRAGSLHYDAVLLSMVDEIEAKYGIDTRRFAMFGFSGGGHFTHRFLYLHPERLSAASIGAPGVVTLLDRERDFWVGVRNFESVFGKKLDIEAIRDVPTHMVIGGDDTETWEITIKPGSSWWMDGADIAGGTRLNRMKLLKASLEAAGVKVRHDVVPGVAHRVEPMIPAVTDFLSSALGAKP